jgi:hypothetical protein
VYYPDARDFAGAGQIRLSAGQPGAANFNLTLEPFQTVTAAGLFRGNGTGGATAPSGPLAADVLDPAGHPLPYIAQYDEASHEIQAMLPDGTYTLLLRGFRNPELGSEINSHSSRAIRRAGASVGSVDFTVAGHPLTGLRVPLSPQQTSTVQLRYLRSGAGGAPPNGAGKSDSREPISLTVERADALSSSEDDDAPWPADDGQDTIEFTVAQPGAYWLGVLIPQRTLCAGSLTSGGASLAREPAVLSPFASTPAMELTLRDDCAQLALTLPQAQSVFLPGEEPFYNVYVVPDFDSVQDIPPMTMHPSSGPTLKLDGLTPGSYHVYTFLTPVHLEYRNPAALAASPNAGQQVTLSPGATSNLVLEAPGS